MKTKLFIVALISILLSGSCFGQDNVSVPALQVSNANRASSGVISTSKYTISVIDPTPKTNPLGTYYPGLRAGGQLVIYTPAYGKRTGTNEFGREAVVINDVVVGLLGANSPIPDNGFIISGHGRAKNWINKNLIEGAKVKIDKDTNRITSTVTAESYTYKARQKAKYTREIMKKLKQSNPMYKAEESEDFLKRVSYNLALAQSYINKQNYSKAQKYSNIAVKYADQAFYHAIPPKVNELHGVWLRPTEKNVKQISKTLDKLKSTGINNIFLETYYQGYTIFPSKTLDKYGILPQRKEFVGWDPLKVWIDEAHKRNIKVSVWFQTFYAGNEDISKNPKHIISVYPSWANFQKRNIESTIPMPSLSEHSGYFLDPANPEVQTYLSDLIKEIVSNYEVDGLNIDYIRYPASLLPDFPGYVNSTWGYTAYARNEFKTLYGADPVCLDVTSPLWTQWVKYRQNKVTKFVSKLKKIVQNKNITISAVIFPDPQESAVVKLQDWRYWGKNNLVDSFTPLVMGSDESLIEEYLKQIKCAVGNNVKIYPGLFEPFTGGDPVDMLKQLQASRQSGANGVVIFDYAHLYSKYIDALKSGAFRSSP